jgi:hypothetical protein
VRRSNRTPALTITRLQRLLLLLLPLNPLRRSRIQVFFPKRDHRPQQRQSFALNATTAFSRQWPSTIDSSVFQSRAVVIAVIMQLVAAPRAATWHCCRHRYRAKRCVPLPQRSPPIAAARPRYAPVRSHVGRQQPRADAASCRLESDAFASVSTDVKRFSSCAHRSRRPRPPGAK